jgi:hypothetical protein
MAKRKMAEMVRGHATHRRTEADYMGTLLDAVTLDDWRDVVQGALQAAKGGDPQARNWLGQYLVGRPEVKAPSPLTVVVQQLNGADPVAEKLAARVIDRELFPLSHQNDEYKETVRALVAMEIAEKIKPLEILEISATTRPAG